MSLPPRKSHHLTPKHLVGVERDRFYNRLLLGGTIGIVALVVGLVLYTTVYQQYMAPRTTVAEVEGTKINGAQFQAIVRVNRASIINNYMQYIQMLNMFGSDPTFVQQGYQYLSQLASQLEPEVIGNSTINQLVDDQLLQLEAAEMGVTVSEAEIDAEVQRVLGYFPNGTPTSTPETPTSEPVVESTLNATQLALVTATPSLEVTPTRTGTPFATAAATWTPRPPATSSPTDGPSSTPTATATEFTAEGFATAEAAYFESLEAQIKLNEEYTRDYFRASLLREAMFEEVTSGLPHTEEQVWARHILVADEATAQEVLDKLAAGEDWNALASQYSTDTSNKDNGGDLGWFNNTTMVAPFSDEAFRLKVGETSAPIQTDFGWHIIQVLGHEDRPLSDSAYEQLRQTKFQEFVFSLREKYSWTIYDVWKNITPTDPDIPAEYKLIQQ